MKIIFVFFYTILIHYNSLGQEQIAREDFLTYNLPEVNFLPSTITLGKFSYEFRHQGQLMDSSSVLTIFSDNGSIFVGLAKDITEFLIKTTNREKFGIKTMHISSTYEYPDKHETVEVSGWLAGRQVTQPVELEITVFESPGQAFDFTIIPGFEGVDQIKINGKSLQFTLECFTYW